ncbi:amidophosphoribosyltransferase [Tepidanaerobacter syntrophicus]|nr:amidophosphoribosyltransferase [Tepidanaerobacter syntrophicus]
MSDFVNEKKTGWDTFLDILFPPSPYCLTCKSTLTAADFIICSNCRNKIEPIKGALCNKCGKPLPDDSALCYDCISKDYDFIKARSYGTYSGILKKLIYEFKYRGRQEIAEILGRLMYDLFAALSWPNFDYIVPVPLHPRRQRERGFNQSYLLGKFLSSKTNIPIFTGLKRIKPTKHQTLLDKQLRYKNLAGAFAVNSKDKIYGKTLLLIDDVYTTGATTGECSKALIESGAKVVYVLTCARG